MTDRALITGITGQDGSYLAELLLTKGYEVHGIVRPESLADAATLPENIAQIADKVSLHPGTLENHLSLSQAVRTVRPDECYHLAGPSFVEASFEEEPSILATLVSGSHALLAAIKEMAPKCRFFFAGSSEMFGAPTTSPQDETTPFNPRSIYGLAKLSGHHTVRYYRDRYGVFCCTAILYNHESPRRAQTFVPRKVSRAVAAIKCGHQQQVALGRLDARRDWGYAPEYVEAMWMMLQAPRPRDYVVATGETHSVEELVDLAFAHVGLDWREHVVMDERLVRLPEATQLCGDSRRVREELDWRPRKPFAEMVMEMVDADMARIAEAG
jgi:GDPmannose 4,6-dehydratase